MEEETVFFIECVLNKSFCEIYFFTTVLGVHYKKNIDFVVVLCYDLCTLYTVYSDIPV